MPCYDDGRGYGDCVPGEAKLFVDEKLDIRTAQACLAMRILEKLVPNWTPETAEEKKLAQWFVQHKAIDEERARKRKSK